MSDTPHVSTNAEIKYLDYTGLEILWNKIKRVFPQTTNLGDILDHLVDSEGNDASFARKSYVDLKDADIWTRIEQMDKIIGEGANVDGDTIVSIGEDKKLQTNIILDIDEDTRTLRLVTKADPFDESSDVKTIVSSIDYTPFIKDSFLDSASIVVIPDDETESISGQAPGTYIKFVFNTDVDGTQKDVIYLSTEDLGIKSYIGSTYISIVDKTDTDGNPVKSVELNTVQLDSYLEDYISNRSAKITSIVTSLRDVQSTLSTYAEQIGTLESTVAELEPKVTEATRLVTMHEERIVWLETNAANTSITETEIDTITSNLS